MTRKIEFIESYIKKDDEGDYRWNDNHGELIRCKDCRFWQNQEEGVVEVPICIRPLNKHEEHPFRFLVGKDDYCSFAERKER